MGRMVGSPAVKLALAVVATLGLAALGVMQTLATFAEDENGNRLVVIRDVERRLAPVWPEIVATFRAALPSQGITVPAGNPDAALDVLLARNCVALAFHVDPAKNLTLRYRLPEASGPGRAGVARSTRVNLATWEPAHVGRAFGLDERLADWSPEKSRRVWLEERILPLHALMVWVWDDRQDKGPWSFEWSPTSAIEQRYFLKGRKESGFIGFAFSLSDFGAEVYPLLERHGLSDRVVCSWHGEGNRVRTPRIPGYDEPIAAYAPSWVTHESVPVAELELYYAGYLALILSALVLTASTAVRQGVAVLREAQISVSKSDFVSGVSHEMRIPLTTVKMYSEMLEQEVVTEPAQRSKYLRTITQEADRLTRLIENVLDFARISNRRRTYRFEPLEVHELVGEAVAAVERPLAEAGMTVDRMVPAGLRLKGDRDALIQLLINLLTNAIKYASGEKRILVTAAEEGGSVRLAVQDFGPGIPPAEQKKVFRPFYRVGGELTRRAPGSGLGLALVREYAEAHGGQVRLESRPGEGARFEVVLPAAGKTRPS